MNPNRMHSTYNTWPAIMLTILITLHTIIDHSHNHTTPQNILAFPTPRNSIITSTSTSNNHDHKHSITHNSILIRTSHLPSLQTSMDINSGSSILRTKVSLWIILPHMEALLKRSSPRRMIFGAHPRKHLSQALLLANNLTRRQTAHICLILKLVV